MTTEQHHREMPTFAWVGVTSRCNLDCGHCQRSTLKAQGLLTPVDMPEEIFRKIDAQVFPHLKRVQFGGNNFGEPLLARNWDMYFDIVRKHGIRRRGRRSRGGVTATGGGRVRTQVSKRPGPRVAGLRPALRDQLDDFAFGLVRDAQHRAIARRT